MLSFKPNGSKRSPPNSYPFFYLLFEMVEWNELARPKDCFQGLIKLLLSLQLFWSFQPKEKGTESKHTYVFCVRWKCCLNSRRVYRSTSARQRHSCSASWISNNITTRPGCSFRQDRGSGSVWRKTMHVFYICTSVKWCLLVCLLGCLPM